VRDVGGSRDRLQARALGEEAEVIDLLQADGVAAELADHARDALGVALAVAPHAAVQVVARDSQAVRAELLVERAPAREARVRLHLAAGSSRGERCAILANQRLTKYAPPASSAAQPATIHQLIRPPQSACSS